MQMKKAAVKAAVIFFAEGDSFMRQKKQLARIFTALFLFLLAFLLPWQGLGRLLGFLAVYALIGWDILWRALQTIFRGQVFDENFLMSVATVGAFLLGEYPEGVAVMLFYQIGEWFQNYAVSQSRRSIAGLMDIRPDYAHVKRDEQWVKTDPEEVRVGDIIMIKPGEKVPLDGRVLEGSSALNTAALTGESLPRDVMPQSEVISGCINLTGNLIVQVSKEYGQSTVAKILDLVENASAKKAKTENFITKFARYYTPSVVIAAVLLAVLPPLLLPSASFAVWVARALTFLVISCPCAVVISVPLSFFGGIGAASKSGVLVKGSNYLEALAKAEIVVFDKTGTLTKGAFTVTGMHNAGVTGGQLLELAAYAESFSNHPIALSIRNAYGQELDLRRVTQTEEIPGRGIRAVIDGQTVFAGNIELMRTAGIPAPEEEFAGTAVYVAAAGQYAGSLRIEDEIKADAMAIVSRLRALHIKQIVMLTGDKKAIGEKVAAQIGLDQAYTELLPTDKVAKMEELLKQKSARGKLVFVGDGVNDAPVLARSDIGIAMGGLGSDAAIEAADVVIMTDELAKIPVVMRIARQTLRIAKQNIVFALGVKFLVLLLGAAGIATMWAAVFADVGVSVIAILNAIRVLYVKSA